jgi:O-antigen/teichoic acid export membrane protein
VLAAIVLATNPTLRLLGMALIAPPVVALVVSYAAARRLTGVGADIRLSALTLHGFARDAAPIGIGVLVSAIYFRCDVYFLGYWHGLDVVGMYNAVFRLVEALRLFPAAVLAVVFPELCRATKLRPLKRLGVVLASVGALAMAVTITAAPGIVHLAYGAPYAEAAAPLQVLGLALPLFFFNYALTHQVIAWNGQRLYLAITVAALVTNVVGNVALIPTYGMLGAACSTVMTEIAVTAGCLLALKRQRVAA